MDGWFWRLTDPVGGRVVFALAGLCTPRQGEPWGIVGLGADPAAALATARLDRVRAATTGMDLDFFGERGHFRASRDHLDVRIDDCRLRVDLSAPVDWQGRLGGSSIFQLVPRLPDPVGPSRHHAGAHPGGHRQPATARGQRPVAHRGVGPLPARRGPRAARAAGGGRCAGARSAGGTVGAPGGAAVAARPSPLAGEHRAGRDGDRRPQLAEDELARRGENPTPQRP